MPIETLTRPTTVTGKYTSLQFNHPPTYIISTNFDPLSHIWTLGQPTKFESPMFNLALNF